MFRGTKHSVAAKLDAVDDSTFTYHPLLYYSSCHKDDHHNKLIIILIYFQYIIDCNGATGSYKCCEA